MQISNIKIIVEEQLVNVTIDGRVVSLQALEDHKHNCLGCFFNPHDDRYVSGCPTLVSDTIKQALVCSEGNRQDCNSIVWVRRQADMVQLEKSAPSYLLLDNKTGEFRRVKNRQDAIDIVNASCFGGDNGYSINDFTLIEYPVEKSFESVTTVKIAE